MMNNAFWGGLLFTILALYMLKHTIKSLSQYETSKQWPAVQGEITQSRVVRYQATSSSRDFIGEYKYQIEGKQYQGYRVALYTIMHQAEAEALADKYPIGSKATIYYYPEKPSESVLITGGREDKKYGEVILAAFVTIVGISVMISAYYGLLDK